MATVWILNLDAEFEMAQPSGYAPSNNELRGLEVGVQKALRVLPADTIVASLEDIRSGKFSGVPARAWCPTPRVQDACQQGAVSLEPACAYDVIRAVNDRAFRASLADEFPCSHFVKPGLGSTDEVLRLIHTDLRNWLLKRAYGVASRGQHRIRGNEVQPADLAWIEASLRLGGLQVEPCVRIDAEYSLHGRIEANGRLELGTPCVAMRDTSGHFESAGVADSSELDPGERKSLVASGMKVAEALFDRGYFGPFGIDAFRWQDDRGQLQFRSLSEINARYTLGWTVVMRASGA